jgi:threonine/homoserine/homoserine lactone efflux protein
MLLFLGAFLQQFVDPAFPAFPQMLVLAASFLIVAVTTDTLWAVLAARPGEHIAGHRSHRLAGRMAGSILIATGVTLALIRWCGYIDGVGPG